MCIKVKATVKAVINNFQRVTKTSSAKQVYTTSDLISSIKPVINIEVIMQEITLSNSEAIAYDLLNSGIYVNTFEFREKGLCNVAQIISQLKGKGAIIDKYLMSATDSFGNQKKKIAHYKLVDWVH